MKGLKSKVSKMERIEWSGKGRTRLIRVGVRLRSVKLGGAEVLCVFALTARMESSPVGWFNLCFE